MKIIEKLNLTIQIEAILYLKGKAITLKEITEYAKCTPDEAQEVLISLMSDYAHRNTALEVAETPNGYTLQLRSSCQPLLENLIPSELNTSTLRTLAAIAIKNPILQSELIELRGSSAYNHVQELIELGFIDKRRQEEGRSYWLEITKKFHQYFEINQLSP